MKFEHFDSRHYETLPVVEGYRIWAEVYDDMMGDEMDLHLFARLESVDWSGFENAADLACGTGRIGVWLRAQGVGHVDGVDFVMVWSRMKGSSPG